MSKSLALCITLTAVIVLKSFCVAADGEPLTLDTRAADKTDKNENCKFIKLSRFLYN